MEFHEISWKSDGENTLILTVLISYNTSNQEKVKMGNKAASELGNRPLEYPLSLSTSNSTIIALESVPPRELGFIEETGRIRQNDIN